MLSRTTAPRSGPLKRGLAHKGMQERSFADFVSRIVPPRVDVIGFLLRPSPPASAP